MVSITKKISNALRHQGLRGLTGRINKRLGIIGPSRAATGRTCLRPFYFAGIGPGGEVYCCCSGWVKYRLGKLTFNKGMKRIWNGRIARKFRESMCHTDLGRVCQERICPYIIDDRLPYLESGRIKLDDNSHLIYPDYILQDKQIHQSVSDGSTVLDVMPQHIEIGVDTRCNLYCRSCRNDRVTTLSQKEERVVEVTYQAVRECGPDLRTLSLLGSGEVFYSPFGIRLLRGLNRNDFPVLGVDIMTNGQLFSEKSWDRIGGGREFVTSVTVSIDAASEQTYEFIRRGGTWKTLLANMAFIRELRVSGKIRNFSICFVVSAENFREMPDFVRFGEKFGVDNIIFTSLQPWSSMTYDHGREDVTAISHPLYPDFKKILEDTVLHQSHVVLGF